MARAPKKSSRNATGKKVNKTAWIRSQSASTPAKELVAKAKAEGITLSVAQVYTARSTGKKAGAVRTTKARVGRPAAGTGKSDELAFRRLVLSIGLPKAEAFLADLKRSVGL